MTWVALEAGGEFRLGKTRVLQAFATVARRSEPTLGYAVLEERRRLKPEFAGRPEAEIRALARQGGRDALMEAYRHVLFAHTGDAMPIDPALVAGADMLVHDATFLDLEDRKWEIHATTAEALEVGRARQASAASCCTTSRFATTAPPRFPALRAQVAASGLAGGCWLLDEGAACHIEVAPAAEFENGSCDEAASGLSPVRRRSR